MNPAYITRMNHTWLSDIISGCIRSAIDAHGPIQYDNVRSAAKRIAAQLDSIVRQQIESEKAARLARRQGVA